MENGRHTRTHALPVYGKQFDTTLINHPEFVYQYFCMVFPAMRQIWWNLAEISTAVVEKKALEIEQTDARTYTQYVFYSISSLLCD